LLEEIEARAKKAREDEDTHTKIVEKCGDESL